MTELTQIIKNDFRGFGQVISRIAIGAFQGTYTPVILTTSFRQFNRDHFKGDQSAYANAFGLLAQFATAGLLHANLAFYALEKDKGWLYFGALAATNGVDYLLDVYRRSREQ